MLPSPAAPPFRALWNFPAPTSDLSNFRTQSAKPAPQAPEADSEDLRRSDASRSCRSHPETRPVCTLENELLLLHRTPGEAPLQRLLVRLRAIAQQLAGRSHRTASGLPPL